MKSAIAIVQPIFISRPGQTVPELYDVTDVGRSYGCVWWRRTHGRTIIQTVPGTTLAQVTWYLDREISRVRDLKRNTKETPLIRAHELSRIRAIITTPR